MCVETTSEQGSFFQDDLKGHMPRFTLKMNVFPLKQHKCVLKPSEQGLKFSEMSDLKGHMPMDVSRNGFPDQ